MAHIVHHKHVQRRLIARRYARRQPFFFGLPGCRAAATEPPVPLPEQLQVYQRYLDRSRWHGYGKKSYKRMYHRRRRLEARQLEYASLCEREDLFEHIVPEGWRGGIGWDIW
jgi:hypothetical protein